MMVLCLCALKFMDPFSFAVPKKQLGSQMQRQKDGLVVHTPIDGSFNSAINYPGVTIEVTPEEERLKSQLRSIAKGRRRGGWKEVKQLLSKYTGYSAVVFTAAMQAALKCRRYLEGAKMFERLRDVEAPIDAPVSRYLLVQLFCLDSILFDCVVAYALKRSSLNATIANGTIAFQPSPY